MCTGATWTLYIVYIALMLLSNNNSVRKCYGTTAFKNIYVPRSTIFNCDRIEAVMAIFHDDPPTVNFSSAILCVLLQSVFRLHRPGSSGRKQYN